MNYNTQDQHEIVKDLTFPIQNGFGDYPPKNVLLPDECAALDYTLAVDVIRADQEDAGLWTVKHENGGERQGGQSNYRLIGIYPDLESAFEIAHIVQDCEYQAYEANGADRVAAWGMMASLSYELGQRSGTIEPGEHLFTDDSLRPDPFTITPMETLIAQSHQDVQPAVYVPTDEDLHEMEQAFAELDTFNVPHDIDF